MVNLMKGVQCLLSLSKLPSAGIVKPSKASMMENIGSSRPDRGMGQARYIRNPRLKEEDAKDVSAFPFPRLNESSRGENIPSKHYFDNEIPVHVINTLD